MTTTGLVTQLLEQRETRTLQRLHKQLERLDVLILDELGYVPFSKTGAELLFDVVSRAYERTSLILTTNLASTHTDGPNYEKLGWQEVVWTTLFSTVYEHDLYNLYAKILRDVRVGQRTNGLCGTIAPNYFTTTNSPSGGMYDDAPDWGSAMFSAPWQIYQAYGDLKILADNYGAMTNYLAYMKSL